MAADTGQADLSMLADGELPRDVFIPGYICMADETSGFFAFDGVFGVVWVFAFALGELVANDTA
jgi:hypothetical protein